MHDESLPAADAASMADAARRRAFIAGLILAGGTVLEIAAMAHHPSLHSPDIAQAAQQIARLSRQSAWVHGSLLALMLIIAFGFSEFALRRDLRRPLVRAGAVFYGVGVLVMIGAGLVSGFIITDLMSLTPHVTDVDLQINAQLLILCRVLNQSCANFATVSISAGILFWSIDLLHQSGLPRLIGALGLGVGILPVFALMFGLMRLNVHGMMAVLLLQALWNVAVGLAMARSRI
jgi:hypothetical protein